MVSERATKLLVCNEFNCVKLKMPPKPPGPLWELSITAVVSGVPDIARSRSTVQFPGRGAPKARVGRIGCITVGLDSRKAPDPFMACATRQTRYRQRRRKPRAAGRSPTKVPRDTDRSSPHSELRSSALVVLVVAAPPCSGFVAPFRGSVEPLVHAPQAVEAARIGGVRVINDPILQRERAHARPLSPVGGRIDSAGGGHPCRLRRNRSRYGGVD